MTHAFTARYQDELTVEVGDEIELLQQPDGGWFEGRLGGKIGWFPDSHIQVNPTQFLDMAPPQEDSSTDDLADLPPPPPEVLDEDPAADDGAFAKLLDPAFAALIEEDAPAAPKYCVRSLIGLGMFT